jgi:hypothetical protein
MDQDLVRDRPIDVGRVDERQASTTRLSSHAKLRAACIGSSMTSDPDHGCDRKRHPRERSWLRPRSQIERYIVAGL